MAMHSSSTVASEPRLISLTRSAVESPLPQAAAPGVLVFDLDSDEPLPEIPEACYPLLPSSPVAALPREFESAREPSPPEPAMGAPESVRPGGSLWLEGDVLMCACPDCSAPMSVRLWLMIADCWQCHTSIELTEEQEREVQRLLQARERAESRAAAPMASAAVPTSTLAPPAATTAVPPKTPTTSRRTTVTPTPASTAATLAPPTRPRGNGQSRALAPAASPPPAPRRRVSAAENWRRRRLQKTRRRGGWLAGLLRDTPAWLISLVLHMVLLTLLALLTMPGEDDSKYITLNVEVSKDLRREGQEQIERPADVVQFDLPVPPEVDLENKQTREAIQRADQEARELRIVDTADPQLPDLEKVKQQIGTHSGARAAVASRDPRVRVEILQQEGGTTLTEAAVARGLRWLASRQQSDGHWSLDGGTRSDSAATSLALLPFLGAGQTHLTGRYRGEVARGLRWLVQHQRPDGDLRAGSSGNSGMYAHGQAAIVLCEAFLMTGDEELRVPAQKAIDFIVKAQYPDGGWRYKPNSESAPGERRGDTSVVGWQLMALQSARAANLTVPSETFELASHYLDAARHRDGKQYCYQPNSAPSHVMTAEALLCRVYLGTRLDEPGFMEAIEHLAQHHLPSENDPNMYYWYYGTQAFHHVGGSHWDRWNLRMRDVLVNSQDKIGREAGSWPPRGQHDGAGGRIYTTALAVCSLEVYYRHLPIFRQLEVK
jgi:hypothetical protein